MECYERRERPLDWSRKIRETDAERLGLGDSVRCILYGRGRVWGREMLPGKGDGANLPEGNNGQRKGETHKRQWEIQTDGRRKQKRHA